MNGHKSTSGIHMLKQRSVEFTSRASGIASKHILISRVSSDMAVSAGK